MNVPSEQGHEGAPGQQCILVGVGLGHAIQLAEQINRDGLGCAEVTSAIGLFSGEVVRLEIAVHAGSALFTQLYPVPAPMDPPAAGQMAFAWGLARGDGSTELLQLPRC